MLFFFIWIFHRKKGTIIIDSRISESLVAICGINEHEETCNHLMRGNRKLVTGVAVFLWVRLKQWKWGQLLFPRFVVAYGKLRIFHWFKYEVSHLNGHFKTYFEVKWSVKLCDLSFYYFNLWFYIFSETLKTSACLKVHCSGLKNFTCSIWWTEWL